MNVKKTFCEECRKDVSYHVASSPMKESLRGEEYDYVGTKATCAECGSEVYVATLADENLRLLRDAFRQKNGLISVEGIIETLDKYDIGKRPLSLLLGWGEMTVTRYCNGDMPTKQYSDVLQRINEDVSYYSSLLEQNKAKLTQVAYEKSKRAAQKLLGAHASGIPKMDAVIEYILSKCGEITPLALQKVLYYAQGFYYAFAGAFLFDEDCEAWVHGPVFRTIYHRYAHLGYGPIEGTVDVEASEFTDVERAVFDSIIRNFCCFSGKILKQFTHSEAPWLEARGNLPAELPTDRKISKEAIGRFFAATKEKYNMLSPGDIESYAQIMFRRTAGS